MRVVHGAEEARRTVLRREPLEGADVPEHVRARDRALFGPGLSVAEVVDRILEEVRTGGDAAVRTLNRALDGAETADLRVSREEIEAAYREVPAALVESLRFAAERVRAFHERQLQQWMSFEEEGIGQLVRPLERVGLYMPGTATVYPSSVIMMAVPARVAGVSEVYLASPARADGSVSPLKLVAADIAGVDAVFRAGGAHAVAAFAYGTETIPRVDKICGPGNIWVTLAKRKVFGVTGIDAIYGPTETIVIADETADPALCAADLLAQAEHDELAGPILITTSRELAERVEAELQRQLPLLERAEVCRAALEGRGGMVVVETLEQAVDLANEFAPEHLCLLVRDAWKYTALVKHAGGVFVGEDSPEVLGDYTAGPSHVMPTGGSARWSSPLSVNDFVKVVSLVAVDRDGLERLGPHTAAIARAEGFTAHARAVEIRLARRG